MKSNNPRGYVPVKITTRYPIVSKNPETKLMYFTGVNQSRFKKTITPGDQIIFEVKLEKFKMGTCILHGTASVDGSQVAEGEILASVVDRRS